MAGWSTTDIALAAWVSMIGGGERRIRLVKVERNGKASEFVFSDPDGRVDEVIAAFPHSEAHRFDSCVRALKSLGYSRNRRN